MYAGAVCCFFLLAPGVDLPRQRTEIAERLTTISEADPELGALLESLVTPTNPTSRPSAVEVMRSPVFRNVSTNMIMHQMQQEKLRADKILPSESMPGIDDDMGVEVKLSMQGHIKGDPRDYLPPVAVTFATGNRPGKDTKGNGPGMVYASVSAVGEKCGFPHVRILTLFASGVLRSRVILSQQTILGLKDIHIECFSGLHVLTGAGPVFRLYT